MTARDLIQLDIVSAERQLFSGEVEWVVASGEWGELGIMPGHSPLLSLLKPGEVRFKHRGGPEHLYYVSSGMLEVQPHTVTVLADAAERADDLDETAALAAKSSAQEMMSRQGVDIDYTRVAAELARAMAQIRAIQKLRQMRK